jgi:hypothetical protein
MQQHRIDCRENRGVRTDRQRERQDRDETEGGVFQKLAEGESKILQHGLST